MQITYPPQNTSFFFVVFSAGAGGSAALLLSVEKNGTASITRLAKGNRNIRMPTSPMPLNICFQYQTWLSGPIYSKPLGTPRDV